MKKKLIASVTIIALTLIILFFFGGFSFQTAPYVLPPSPIVAYRITGNEGDIRYFTDDPNSIHGYAIIQRQAITDPQLQQDVIDLLNSRLIYGNTDILCFEPGVAIQLGQGQNQIDALICLTCQKIYFYRGGQVAYRQLNSDGVSRLKSLYPRLFPGHTPDGSDADAQRVADARTKERERLQQALIDSSSTPATAPAP